MKGFSRGGRRWLSPALPVLVLIAGAGCEAQRLSPEEFRDRFVVAYRQADPTATVRVLSDQEVQITRPDGRWVKRYTGNAYELYRGEPAELQRLLDRQVSSARMSLEPLEVDAEKLIVLVRPSDYTGADGGADGDPAFSRPFSPDLRAFVGLDSPEAQIIPTREDLAKLGQTSEAIWSTALANSARLRGAPKLEQLAKNAVVVATEEGLASSILLDSTLAETPALKALGARPAALIGKSMVVVVNGDDPAAVAGLQRMAAAERGDWISGKVYRREGAAWVAVGD